MPGPSPAPALPRAGRGDAGLLRGVGLVQGVAGVVDVVLGLPHAALRLGHGAVERVVLDGEQHVSGGHRASCGNHHLVDGAVYLRRHHHRGIRFHRAGGRHLVGEVAAHHEVGHRLFRDVGRGGDHRVGHAGAHDGQDRDACENAALDQALAAPLGTLGPQLGKRGGFGIGPFRAQDGRHAQRGAVRGDARRAVGSVPGAVVFERGTHGNSSHSGWPRSMVSSTEKKRNARHAFASRPFAFWRRSSSETA